MVDTATFKTNINKGLTTSVAVDNCLKHPVLFFRGLFILHNNLPYNILFFNHTCMDHVSVMLSHVPLSHNSLISIVDVIILMMSNYGKKNACWKKMNSR